MKHKLLTLITPYKKEVAIALLALFLTAFIILLFGEAAKYYIDHSLKEVQEYSRLFFLEMFILMVAALSFAGYLRSWMVNSVCFKVIRDLKQSAYQNIIKISPQFFQENKIGDIISRISSDTNKVFEILSGNFAFFLRNLVLFIGSLIFLLLTSVKLTLISVFSIFLAVLPIFIFSKKLKSLSKSSQEVDAKVNSEIEESVLAIKEIQAYCAESAMIEKFSSVNQDSLSVDLKKVRLKSMLVALTIFFAFLSIALILFLGIADVMAGKISAGKFSSFVFYAVIAAISSVGLGQIFSQLQTLDSALERIYFLINVKSQVQEKPDSIAKIDSKNIEINFKNVDFSYNRDAILKNFNLEVKQGQKIAIFGESGVGKSTIFNLLLRFYDIDHGKIYLNGMDIQDLSLKALRDNFAYVLQDSFMFSGTIFDNISYGCKNVSRAQINKIIARNPAFSFIKNMKNGVDSNIGERGSSLSGGQKQRIAILRALLSESKILLFDEATSALDPENEELILKLINEIAQEKTVIFIAHKISPIIKFDQVIEVS